MPRKKKEELPPVAPLPVPELICDACSENIDTADPKPFFAFHTKCAAAISHRLEYLATENAMLRKQLSALMATKKGRRGHIH